ncbi:Fusaric acid resistance protein-like-domain-containing protein [Phlyctochytrium arcticum]|nr:Fusaric acid resistance protein-like-domain-containing protein [Phlyctochytrium arcticum]
MRKLLDRYWQSTCEYFANEYGTIRRTLLIPLNAKRMFKCILAFYLTMLFSLVPVLAERMQPVTYIAPLAILFFHPARTVGAQAENLFTGMAGVFIGSIWTLATLAALGRYFEEYPGEQQYIGKGAVGLFSVLAFVFLATSLNAKYPHLRSFAMNGCIIVVLMVPIAFDNPTFSAELVSSCLKGYGVAVGIGLILNIALWPEFANDLLRDAIRDSYKKIHLCLEAEVATFLSFPASGAQKTPRQHTRRRSSVSATVAASVHLNSARAATMKIHTARKDATHEITYGYFQPNSIRSIERQARLAVRHMGGMSSGLAGMHEVAMGENKDVIRALRGFVQSVSPTVRELKRCCLEGMDSIPNRLFESHKSQVMIAGGTDVELGKTAKCIKQQLREALQQYDSAQQHAFSQFLPDSFASTSGDADSLQVPSEKLVSPQVPQSTVLRPSRLHPDFDRLAKFNTNSRDSLLGPRESVAGSIMSDSTVDSDIISPFPCGVIGCESQNPAPGGAYPTSRQPPFPPLRTSSAQHLGDLDKSSAIPMSSISSHTTVHISPTDPHHEMRQTESSVQPGIEFPAVHAESSVQSTPVGSCAQSLDQDTVDQLPSQVHWTNEFYSVCFFAFSLREFATAILDNLEAAEALEARRDNKRHIFWPRSSLFHRFGLLLHRGGGRHGNTKHDETCTTAVKMEESDPAAKGFQPVRWFVNLLDGFHKSLGNRHVRFGLKSVLAVFLGGVWAFLSATRSWYIIQHGYWTTFTIVVVMSPTIGGTSTTAVYRVMGTIFGALWAYISILIARDRPGIVFIVMLPIAIAGFYLPLFGVRKYAGIVLLLTYCTVCIVPFEPGNRQPILTVAISRTITIFVGCAIALVVTWGFFPHLARHDVRTGVSRVTRDLAALYALQVGVLLTPPDADLSKCSTPQARTEASDRLLTRTQVRLVKLRADLAVARGEPDLDRPFDANIFADLIDHLQSLVDIVAAMRDTLTPTITEGEMSALLWSISEQRRSLVGALVANLHIVASCVEMKARLPAHLPSPIRARARLQKRLQEVMRGQDVSSVSLLYLHAYACTTKRIVGECDALQTSAAELLGIENLHFKCN